MENSTETKINTARDGVTQIGKDLRADAHATIDALGGWLDALADEHERLPYLAASATLEDAANEASNDEQHQDQERRLTA